MPTCQSCGFSQNLGEFADGFCEKCWKTQAQILIGKLQQDNRDLLNDIHQYKQKLQTHEQTITQLKNAEKTQKENLAKLQEKWDNHLTQEKSFLQKEIQLIKEALHD